MPKIILSFLILTLLLSCGTQSTHSSGSRGPSTFLINLPKTSSEFRKNYMLASTSHFTNDGIITRMDVSFNLMTIGNSLPNRIPVFVTSPEQAMRVARSFSAGQDSDAVYALAVQIARATYCRTGPISPNNGITGYSNPADIQAIMVESTRLNRDAVPAGLRGEAIPATRYRPNGTRTKWEVSLICRSTNPYR